MVNELNEEIKEAEKNLLSNELKLLELKHEHDKALFSEILFLEKEYASSKNKELSTAIKRESIAKNKDHIKELKSKYDELDVKIRHDKIELRYLLRKFKIMTMEEGK